MGAEAGVSDGLIPARAGKTLPRNLKDLIIWAHPRACGENLVGGSVGHRGSGSSPRVRGKRGKGVADGLAARLIPARAGKTHVAADVR